MLNLAEGSAPSPSVGNGNGNGKHELYFHARRTLSGDIAPDTP
jgi:hypothetical protein